MTTTAELRSLWAGYLGETAKKEKSVTVPFPGSGKNWNLLVADVAGPAFTLLASIMKAHNYLFLESAGGTWVVRKIGGSTLWSLHSYGIALDINPSKNPFKTCTTNIPVALREDVAALKTNNGKDVFSWGGDWRPCSIADPMHFQIDCGPNDLKTGIAGSEGDDEPMGYLAPCKLGATGEHVAAMQTMLAVCGFYKGTLDGVYGTTTAEAVLAMRKSRGSSATSGNDFSKYAHEQLLAAHAIWAVGASSDGMTAAEVDAKIKTHAANADAHHE